MKRDLIKELKANHNLFAECPDGHIFPLHRAIMFYVDGPIPPEVQKILQDKELELAQRKRGVIQRRKKLKERSEIATKSIGIGKIVEKIAPAMKGFKYDRRDCRALFEPIDYIVFNGLTRNNGGIESLYFIDIKTGNAGLNLHQKQIRDAVKSGRVEWDTFRDAL
ncbi:MAG: Holliday junction resolvase-like protein [bacterium]